MKVEDINTLLKKVRQVEEEVVEGVPEAADPPLRGDLDETNPLMIITRLLGLSGTRDASLPPCHPATLPSYSRVIYTFILPFSTLPCTLLPFFLTTLLPCHTVFHSCTLTLSPCHFHLFILLPLSLFSRCYPATLLHCCSPCHPATLSCCYPVTHQPIIPANISLSTLFPFHPATPV